MAKYQKQSYEKTDTTDMLVPCKKKKGQRKLAVSLIQRLEIASLCKNGRYPVESPAPRSSVKSNI